ncbi:phytoene desaturase family protein [Microvirga pudoricolor]|uniref:phytoene desaturase family protein n=1 Tax=Microvirga pudoricolor TaxID=2778729 RepID=UPI001950B5B2|nr:phytoene desaturase family protein [Microvirga pudoricolor]MBM6593470.1 phytoene desaturase [Microvirga pudoricolor]
MAHRSPAQPSPSQGLAGRVAIVGAGPGGLASAMLLAREGLPVTVFEKEGAVGGRTRTIHAPGGYKFDIGPTFFLYPRVLSDIFAACGERLEDHVEMKRLDPQYHLVFEGGGEIRATPDLDRLEAEIARLSPADARNVRRFLDDNRAKLEAFRPVLEQDFSSPADMVSPAMLAALPKLRPFSSVDQDLKRYFADPRVRLAFSFQTKYLGMSPFQCPSLFTILSFLEYEHGVYHPIGGCGAVSDAMAKVARKMGVDIRLNTPVDHVIYEGGEAVGVQAGGERIPAGSVVINGDFGHAVRRLIPEDMRRNWQDRKIDSTKLSCSTFMLYLGIEGGMGDLAHHTILLSKEYERNIHEITNGILPEEPSIYIQHAGATDPTLAPEGHTSLYVLVPVPNLRCGIDWAREAPRYRKLALERLKQLGLGDIESRIRFERMVTPVDWRDEFSVFEGATFNLAHNLTQMLYFRPHNRFGRNVYLVGGGTHPGSGLPVIYEGARITSRLVLEDLAKRRAGQPPATGRNALPEAAE